MQELTQRIRVTNESSNFVTLWIEPWATDFGMFPNDEFEIVAMETDETFYFHTTYQDKDIIVYPVEGSGTYPTVYQNGNALSTGHNRQKDS
jgi:hypothetical protein